MGFPLPLPPIPITYKDFNNSKQEYSASSIIETKKDDISYASYPFLPLTLHYKIKDNKLSIDFEYINDETKGIVKQVMLEKTANALSILMGKYTKRILSIYLPMAASEFDKNISNATKYLALLVDKSDNPSAKKNYQIIRNTLMNHSKDIKQSIFKD
jgi:hypothetical protein